MTPAHRAARRAVYDALEGQTYTAHERLYFDALRRLRRSQPGLSPERREAVLASAWRAARNFATPAKTNAAKQKRALYEKYQSNRRARRS